MCTVLLPADGNPIAVKYIISYIISCHISYHIIPHHIIYHIVSYRIVSYRIISYPIRYHISSYHIYHIVSHHIIYHITSHHISYQLSWKREEQETQQIPVHTNTCTILQQKVFQIKALELRHVSTVSCRSSSRSV